LREYRVKVSVRNNLLLSAIEAAGYKTQAEFARANEISHKSLNDLIGMRMAPLCSNGEFTMMAKQLMEILGASPNDLWTDDQLYIALSRSSGERLASAEDVKALLADATAPLTLEGPDDALDRSELSREINAALKSLKNNKQKTVLRKRFFEDKTPSEVAIELGVSLVRVRQIESKALRVLRHPSKSKRLRDVLLAHEHTSDSRKTELAHRNKRHLCHLSEEQDREVLERIKEGPMRNQKENTT
jgi:RNA polymerase sigma factor (sigma-70 family)